MLADLKYIEKQLFNTYNDDINGYYNFLNEIVVEIKINKIFSQLKEEDNFSVRNCINVIDNCLVKNIIIDYNICILLKNNKDLIYLYISIFIVKSFQFHEYKNSSVSEEFYNFLESDQLINWASNEFFNLCISFNFKFNNSLDISRFLIRELFIKIFFICIKKNLIEERIIRNKFSKKTHKFFNINLTFNIKNLNIKIYNNPFEMFIYQNNAYLYCNHFSSIIEINRKNMLSNYKFNSNLNFSDSLRQSFFYIDKNRLLDIINDLLIFYKINIESIETSYQELQELLKKAIWEQNLYVIQNISQKIAIYLNLIKLIKISSFDLTNIKIFAPHMICFRGRFYMLSDISYTFNKEFRYCSFLGFYNKDDEIEKKDIYTNKINIIILKYKNFLETCNLINSLESYNDLQIITLLFLTINIAEFNKTKLGKCVTLEQFIKEGIRIINNFDKIEFNDAYDKIKVKYYYYLFTQVLNKTNQKWLVSKDATASCFQHLIKILGYKDLNSIKICNLNSDDTWYDTYEYNIDYFLKEKILIYLDQDDLKNWFNRKFLKPIQMKEAYGMGIKNALIDYFASIQENKLNDSKLRELRKLFYNFYFFLKKNPLLFKHKPTIIINKICNESSGEVIFKNNEKMNLKYYKTVSIQKNYFIGKTRFTKNHLILSAELDNRKMSISSRANYVQGMESAVARSVWIETKCPIIHDCFTIDLYNQSYLLSVVNKKMNNTYHELGIYNWNFEIFSIFIIL